MSPESARPSYIPLPEARLTYTWDDWKVSEDFDFDSDSFLEKSSRIVVRGRIALGIGMYEWIIWRFKRISQDPVPFQLAEAAWCANIDRRYMIFEEFDRDEWLGPVRGPLWCAMTWLIPMILESVEDSEHIESGLSFLPKLCVHVQADPKAFLLWLDQCTDRLIELFPLVEEDLFADVFNDEEESHRGPLVAREFLDPSVLCVPREGDVLCDRFLSTVDYRRNPFLRSPEQLREMGLLGTPYRVESPVG